MVSIFLNTEFIYDGIHSNDMDVCLISTKNGLLEMPFGFGRDIIEEINSGSAISKPYFYGYKRKPLTFEIQIGKIGETEEEMEWTYEERKKIVEWFWKDEYKPFISLDNPEVIYYCTPIGDTKRIDNGLTHGYINITLRCNSPHAYSPTYIEKYFYQEGMSNILEITNESNVDEFYYPEVQFTMKGSKDISIRNLTTGEEFSFTNLKIGETIYVDNNLKQIISDLNETYRLFNFNKKWFRIVKGVNRIEIIGEVDVVFRCTYPISI